MDCPSLDVCLSSLTLFNWLFTNVFGYPLFWNQTLRLSLRLRRICSRKNYLDSNVENLKDWFRKRGYPEQCIKDQVARAFQSASNNSANNSKQLKETDVLLVITYYPRFSSLVKKNLQYLYADREVKKVFTPAPFVSFRSARSLERFLVKSKFYPLDRKVGLEKYNGKQCFVCLNVSETDTNLFKLKSNTKEIIT